MANSTLSNVLGGARYPLSLGSDDDDGQAQSAPVTGNGSATSSTPKPAPKPAPKIPVADKNEPESTGDTDNEQSPKRISFPAGVVVETPSDWTPEVLNEFARTVHTASQKASGSQR